MSDLLAPILVIVDNEVDAFWCFAGFMDRVVSKILPDLCDVTLNLKTWRALYLQESNFAMDQAGMKKQLADLQILLKFVDPELCNYLGKFNCSSSTWLLP